MQTKHTNIAKNLHALYETLPDEVQHAFLQILQNNPSEVLNEDNNEQHGNRTKEQQERAIEIYDAYRDDLNKRQLSNSENYDKTVLTLSSSGLALSLTAIKFAIPLEAATHLYLLNISWWLFGITIFISIVAYWISNKALDIQLEIAEDYYAKNIEDAFSKKNRYSDINNWLNMITGVFFIIATAFIISFVTFNISDGEIKMSDKIIENRMAQDAAPVPRMQAIHKTQNVDKSATIPAMQPVTNTQTTRNTQNTTTSNNKSSK